MVQLSGESSAIDTEIESPACTDRGTGRDARGSISIHASYCVRPAPLTVCCVPAWIRSRLRTPPVPTQAASIPNDVSVVNCGTDQVPLTDVKLPPVAA